VDVEPKTYGMQNQPDTTEKAAYVKHLALYCIFINILHVVDM